MIFRPTIVIILAMFSKSLLSRPVLAIGILFMIIFLFQLRDKGLFESRTQKFTASSCSLIKLKLQKRTPENWSIKCQGRAVKKTDTLAVTINYKFKNNKKNKKQEKAILYREVANYLIHIAKNSPIENLERISWVKVSVITDNTHIDAVSEGRYLPKLTTIKNKKLLAEHLQTTVKVKELIKK